VGTGSGYSAAVLAHLAAEVFSIERLDELAEEARLTLARLGVANVEVIVGDGSKGHPEEAPYEAIAVHAASPAPPRSLLEQLAEDGRLVLPIATRRADLLTVFRREGDVFEQRTIGPCRFVPLIGAEGFAD
jgi:protein-L-isoaspartate(D-aspartate) O-methyltransferase